MEEEEEDLFLSLCTSASIYQRKDGKAAV